MADDVKKVLVIDDDRDIVEVVRMVLHTKGYEILAAYDGSVGWEMVLSERPDLVITDLRMPGVSGLELCRRIRAHEEVSKTPILVISSLGATVDKPEEFWTVGLGSDDFLSKPFDPLSLLGRVEYLLRKGQYISDSPQMISGQSVRKPAAAPGKDPAEVVEDFVMAWNDQDFATEYDCLGEEMLGGLSKDDYVERRRQFFADDKGKTRHEVLDATVLKTSNNVASVAVLREDMEGSIPRRKDERYTLKKAQNGWKIIGVKSRPLSTRID